ncbi:RNA polymerase sigma factor OS=Tsukamurella paurometabola (strain ATCC 8368 / DSM / CCUG 35730/ CIP 100753 / JCM 10117 / KCTC 9821 / NBRC 16120 / NCIMB 702349 / NCTC 13040) OX=521096 GN=Tpau_3772 PE=3 SV=1 [Tsukamurella paurometabola]|uniref:RNA polymerase sigma factor n=1 Tax=Tsukamurella paurometabola (strain ATCC 8368 / DSM 20162 / CCUG 35730 / CIP 100753 / JCM 10117 / KCTC 9821 / NBRC 16120 / NCIMB 702349 / NCTC 13040) TaxID=521096 RepID=D5UYP7_TSUPD|nr:sigma-70 family RNA polymerase sigma factor [Tsukamurella paurometabola]ADG80350.1 RNA polymerase, sigma-24 subunit, ECF subfamily [Tsukamurella paurometabola DSM 20162]SUP39328.1 Probable RNA polymerase sigma-C factor [Tsukamurella paurometabola]
MPNPDADVSAATAAALRAGRGDGTALAEFVALTQHDVRRFVALVAGADEADDLVQETYLRAFGSLHRFEGRSSARTWLTSIARHVVIDAIRHRTARPSTPVGDGTDLDGLAAAPHRDLPEHARVELRDLLERIDDDRREALVLTQVIGFSYAETAQIVGCAIGTIRSRVARARTDLHTLVHGEAADPTRAAG